MSYKINDIEYDEWSVKNQQILDELISREVYCCMTSEMEFMLSKVYDNDDSDNPFDESDLDAMYVHKCPECGLNEEFEETTISELLDEDLKDSYGNYVCPECGLEYTSADEARECCGEDTTVYKCSCGKILNESEYDDCLCSAEVYEWWAVSKWLGEKLKKQGCVVIESYGKSYWGRETTGQAISLDGCIANIAKEMKILDGMENCWKTSA